MKATLQAVLRARRNLGTPDERRRLRVQANLSHAHIAEEVVRAGVPACTRQAVAHWERGTRQPRPDALVAYANVLRALRNEMTEALADVVAEVA